MVYYKAMASRPRPAEDYRYWGGPSPSVSDNVKMDPLSLSASILTVLSAAIATAEVIEALRTVKNVPVQVIAVTNEVTDLKLVLAVAQETIQKAPSRANWPTGDEILTLFHRAKATLAEIEEIWGRMRRPAPMGKSDPLSNGHGEEDIEDLEQFRVSKWGWYREKKNMERCVQQLRETRHNLATAFSALTAARLKTIPDMTLTLQATVVELERSMTSQIQELRDGLYSQRSIVDQPTTPMATPGTSSYMLSIDTSHSAHKCKENCPCQCHAVKRAGTPKWLRNVLGSLFYSYSGSLLLGRSPCNYLPCKQGGETATRFSYHFPSWMVQRAIAVSFTAQNVVGIGGSWSITIPKMLTDADPVWRCINYGTVPQMADLLSQKVISVCDMNKDGKSLLHFAVQYDRSDISAYLLRQGVNKYVEDSAGVSAAMLVWEKVIPVSTSSTSGGKSATLELRRVFHDENIFEDLGLSSLHLCVLNLPEERFQEHISVSFQSINAQDSLGRTPLFWAVALNKPLIVQTLLSWKANVNMVDKHNKTALHWAAVAKTLDIARNLLQHGASPHIQDEFGRTPLHEAAKIAGSEAMILLLLDFQADVDQWDYIYSRTPLHLASYYGQAGNALTLLQNGADISHAISNGRTPLMDAVAYNQHATTELLVKHGAAVDVLDNEGMNILVLAAKYGSAKVMRGLMEADLSLVDEERRDSKGFTASDYFTRFRGRFYFASSGDKESDNEVAQAFSDLVGIVKKQKMVASAYE